MYLREMQYCLYAMLSGGSRKLEEKKSGAYAKLHDKYALSMWVSECLYIIDFYTIYRTVNDKHLAIID